MDHGFEPLNNRGSRPPKKTSEEGGGTQSHALRGVTATELGATDPSTAG